MRQSLPEAEYKSEESPEPFFRSILSRFFLYQGVSTLLVFILLIIIFAVLTPRHVFINPRNIRSLARLVPDLGIISLGIGLLMISGEFDLSISSTIPLCSFLFVQLLKAGVYLPLIVILIFLLGPLFGLLNGLITTKLKLPSFLATLGTMMFWRGILYVFSRRQPIALGSYISHNSLLRGWLTGTLGGGSIPMQVVWFIGFAVILGIVLRFHKFGNWVYTTGDNGDAAKAMGINTDRVKIICFMVVGFLASFTAVMQAIRIDSFAATQAQGFELKAIAAAVIGGSSLLGGVGNIEGVFLGVLTVAVLENGLILMGVPVFGITAFTGGAVILAVILNSYLDRRRMRGGVLQL